MERLQLAFESGETSLSPRRFSIHEHLSRPFEINIVADSNNDEIELASIVGKPASFKLESLAMKPQTRIWEGFCSHMALLRAESKGVTSYLIRIVPDIWLLTQRRGHRIFQRKKLVEIVQQLFEEWGVEARLELTAEYLKHDFVVQYGETDLDFVTRLLERAGITYYFDFQGEKTQLALTDAPHLGSTRKNKPRFEDRPPEAHAAEYVTMVTVSEAVRPGHWAVRDFDFRRKPDYPLFGRAEPAPAPESFYEQYHYQPGVEIRVDPPDGEGGNTPVADDKGKVRHSEKEGHTMARNALAGERASKKSVHFETNCNDLAPGVLFAMLDHPRNDLGPDEKLLVERATLEGVVGQRWNYGVVGVYVKQPYLPTLRAQRPTIAGVQSAIVVGPPGEEIYTDEFGRVRVQFHWDREGQFNDDSSCWIRVSQDWAGAGYGSMLIPRIGQEVLVAFLEGDPEQPLIVGRVYNETERVPYKLPDNKTRSGWKSNSTPRGEGYNEILFEDAVGKEIIFQQAQFDLQKLTKREETERINDNRVIIVGNNRSAVVKTVDAEMVGGVSVRQMISPPSEDDLKILPQKEPTVSPLPTTVEMVANRVIFTTGDASVAFDGNKMQFEANGNITLNARGNDVILEGNRAFINTLSPPPAPKPSPIQAPPPGTFTTTVGETDKAPDPTMAIEKPVKGHWTRAKMLKGQLFVEGASASDVAQGEIGDCYLMAAMAAVANARPDIIEKNMKENPDGTVTVTLCENGKPVDVNVDKEVPVHLLLGYQRYGTSKQKKELWVAMMEKAYAKQFGKGAGYEGIGHGGFASESMSHMTCGKSQTEYLSSYDLSKPDDRKELLDMLGKGAKQPVTASTPDHKSNKGLPPGNHAYAVTGVGKDDKGNDVVNIRNPWNADGKFGRTFSMTLEDFTKAYSNVAVNTPK